MSRTVFTARSAISSPFRELLLRARARRLKAVAEALPAHQTHSDHLEQLRALVAESANALGTIETPSSISQVRERLQAVNVRMEEAIAAMTAANLKPSVPVSVLTDLREAVHRYRSKRAELDLVAGCPRIARRRLRRHRLGPRAHRDDGPLC
jgi:hypothetical protein